MHPHKAMELLAERQTAANQSMTWLTFLSDSLRFLIIVRSPLGPMGAVALTSADKKHFRLANKLPGPDTLITHMGFGYGFSCKESGCGIG